jgi:hypothetical protein
MADMALLALSSLPSSSKCKIKLEQCTILLVQVIGNMVGLPMVLQATIDLKCNGLKAQHIFSQNANKALSSSWGKE